MTILDLLSLISQNGYSALMAAAEEGKTDVVVELVKAGAINLDLQNEVCPMRNTGTQDDLPLETSSQCQ